jgi:hypothetical protein
VTEKSGARGRKGGGAVAPEGVEYAVVVEVDGRKLVLKEFLHDVIGGAVDGMLRALRDVDAPKHVRVDVTRK